MFQRFLLGGLLLLVLNTAAFSQLIEPDTGTAVGTVQAVDAEYLFLKPADEIARRYYLRPNDSANRDALAHLAVGQTVEVKWTREDRRKIDSIRTGVSQAPATPAAAVPSSEQAPPTAAAGTAPAAATSTTLGERVNAGVDDLVAFGNRTAELPLWMPLLAVLTGAAVLLLVAGKLQSAGRPILARRLRTGAWALAVLLVAYGMDRKINRLQSELNTLRTRLTPTAFNAGPAIVSAIAPPTTAPAAVPTNTRPLLFDEAAAKTALAAKFKDVSLRPSLCDAASDVVQIHFGQPQVAAFLAIIDLSNPAVRIKLGTNLEAKTLTSDFAKATGCTIAINGEAGQSPAMNSGFGAWRGWLVADGKTILAEQPGNPRPFLAFDGGNVATYRPMASADRTLPAKKPIVFWGRLDALIDGVVQTENARYRQPRTAMGISANGKKLFLLVADGRQNGYSEGLLREEVGHVLKAFGAANGMLCDEGGSSCLYVQRARGIVNLPSDNGGEERPTYTHFGVSVGG